MSDGKLVSEDIVRAVHEAMQNAPHDGEPYRQARAAIDALQARVSADPMLVEARRLLGDPDKLGWFDAVADWLTAYDATHGVTPTARECKNISSCSECGGGYLPWCPACNRTHPCPKCGRGGTPTSNAGTGTP